jgi:hypothetical protein
MTGKKKMCIFILKIKIQQQFQLIFFLKNINRKKKTRRANFVSKRAVSVPVQGLTCTTYCMGREIILQ